MNQVPTVQKEIACFGYVLTYHGEIAKKESQMLQMYNKFLQDSVLKSGYNFIIGSVRTNV